MKEALITIAKAAGEKILKVRSSGTLNVQHKQDGSPSTMADAAAEEEILSGLARLSNLKIVSEETTPPKVLKGEDFWLVDPLDGTKDFVSGADSFCVLIALMQAGEPVTGVLHAPVLNETVYCERGGGVWFNDQRLPLLAPAPLSTAIVSQGFSARSEEFMRRELKVENFIRKSSAVKFADIARGRAQIYPRFGQTSEWDTAVGQLFLEELGGSVLDLETFEPLRYRKSNWLNSGGFIAMAPGPYQESLLERIRVLAEERSKAVNKT